MGISFTTALKLRLTGPSFKCEEPTKKEVVRTSFLPVGKGEPGLFSEDEVVMAAALTVPATRVMNQHTIAEAVIALEEQVKKLQERVAELEKTKR